MSAEPTTKAGRELVTETHEAMHEDGCECDAAFIRDRVLAIEAEARRPVTDAAARTMGEAWRDCMAVLPLGWRWVTLAPTDPDSYGYDGQPWVAGTCSTAFYEGETDDDDEQAQATGGTPIAAVDALSAALRERAA